MQQKLFVLIVNPDLEEECVSSRKKLDELLEKGWRIIQATPVILNKIYSHICTHPTPVPITNSIIYVIEKD